VRDLAVLLLHLLATVARLAGPGGARSVVAESVLVKHLLLILNHGADEAWPKGTEPGRHRRSRRHETAKSHVGVSTDRATDRFSLAIPITKEVVRRILAVRYQPTPRPDSTGPSWLTVLGHTKDSLWSLDLFRCESAIVRTHWVLVVMDQCTRRIVGPTTGRCQSRRDPGLDRSSGPIETGEDLIEWVDAMRGKAWG
jgi:hypothetical protein